MLHIESLLRCLIDLAKERRAALITAAITGQTPLKELPAFNFTERKFPASGKTPRNPWAILDKTLMRTCTPSAVTKQLLGLTCKLAPGQSPIYLRVQPEADSKMNECFPNVEAKIQKDGGSIVYGWQLWEWPHVLIEAEFHAVWCSSEGDEGNHAQTKWRGNNSVPPRSQAGVPGYSD